MAESENGRPTSYSQELGDVICQRLADGESLRAICREPGMPDKATVFRWILNQKTEFDSFRDQYALARSIQYEGLADEIMDIADDGSNDYMEREGTEIVNPEAIGRSRLRVDTRKWFLGKVLPKFKDKPEDGDSSDHLAAALEKLADKLPGA